jgi:transcriptional regulator
MYVPPIFEESRPEVLAALMRDNPFATVVSNDAETGPAASHVPVFFDATGGAHGSLRFHLARPNPHAAVLAQGGLTLVIFHGPHAYVSPTWYRSGKPAVPTWNYAVVHCYGRPRVIEGEHLARHLGELVATFEPADGYSLERQPADFLEKMRGAIVGFEMPIERIEGKRKLGQNRVREDRLGAADGLEASEDPAGRVVGALMRSAAPVEKPT